MSRFPNKMRVVLLLLLLVGCGGPTQDEARSERPTELHIPLEPVTQSPHVFMLDEVVDAGEGRATMRLWPGQVILALGDEYPSAVDIEFSNDGTYMPCLLPTGDWEITEVSGGGDVVEATRTGATGLRLERGVEGEAMVEVAGRFVPSDALASSSCWSEYGYEQYEQYEEFEFEIAFAVTTSRVADVRVSMDVTCDHTTEPLFFLGDSLEAMSVVALDANGEALSPSNASLTRPVSLTLTAPPGAELKLIDADKGLSGVELPQVKGTIEVASHLGRVHQIEVVEPSQVTSIGMSFNLRGLSPYPFELETGRTYGEDGFEGDNPRVVPSHGVAKVDDMRVCTKLPDAFFELISLTPETCPIEQGIGSITKVGPALTGNEIGTSALLTADGVCELRVQTPEFNHGQGLSAEFEATFVNVRSTD